MSEEALILIPKFNTIKALFNSAELEHSYRQYYLDNDKRQAIITIILFTIPITIFSYSDYQFFGFTTQFYKLITVRILMILFSLISLFILLRLKQEKGFDAIIFGWVFLICTFVLYVASTRPSDYFFHLVVDIPVLFAIYVLFITRLQLQLITALYQTIGIFWIFFHYKNLSPITTRALWVSLIVVNIFGLIFSRRLHFDRRTQYDLLINEKRLAGELKEAFEKIKTLKGLLPICASCKKIRDDGGYWHQVEVYIRDHTDVNFSHGICPDCVKSLYPNVKKKKET